MAGGGNRCLKILVLVTLIPVALRASLLLIGGHGGGAPATASSRSWSWHVVTQPAGLSVSSAASVQAHKAYQQTARQRRRRTTDSAAVDIDARWLRRVRGNGGDWFQDDKRLAPTGSNPLHNLRR